MLVLVPLMLLALPLPPTVGRWAVYKQDWVLDGAILCAVLALLAYLVLGRRSTLALIVLGASLLLIGHITWNKAYRKYVATHAYKREVFRRPMRNIWAPMYGRYDNSFSRW